MHCGHHLVSLRSEATASEPTGGEVTKPGGEVTKPGGEVECCSPGRPGRPPPPCDAIGAGASAAGGARELLCSSGEISFKGDVGGSECGWRGGNCWRGGNGSREPGDG